MRMMLDGIPNGHHYIDDIIVATDNWEQHVMTLKIVLSRVKEAGLPIKPKKCEIGMRVIMFLGHWLGDGVIQPSVENLDKIIKSKRPEIKWQVRAFLGLAGYYREFILDYARGTWSLERVHFTNGRFQYMCSSSTHARTPRYVASHNVCKQAVTASQGKLLNSGTWVLSINMEHTEVPSLSLWSRIYCTTWSSTASVHNQSHVTE